MVNNNDLKSPIDLKNKDVLVQKKELGKRPFYSETLSRVNRNEEKTTFGGTVKRDNKHMVDEGTVSAKVGQPGGSGVDEGIG